MFKKFITKIVTTVVSPKSLYMFRFSAISQSLTSGVSAQDSINKACNYIPIVRQNAPV